VPDEVDEEALAAACARGEDGAIRTFEARYFGGIVPALRRMGLGAAEIDEVTQAVRERLFVAEGDAPPRVAGVAGQGDLRALVRVMAIRAALNARRRDRRLVLDDAPLLDQLAPSGDPELQAIAEAGRAAVRQAFEGALAGLDRKERALLRMHLLHRLTLEDIARVYRVHRATAARWLAAVRDKLERDTRRSLRQALGSEGRELDSVLQAARSRLELSFDRLLGSTRGG
jgi:RNA polymerase sigma-70 factor, ECF subfamily